MIRAPEAIDVRVGGEFVLHEPESGRYVRLNSSAAGLWDRLREPVSLGELAAESAARHSIEVARAERDIVVALDALLRRRLAHVVDPGR